MSSTLYEKRDSYENSQSLANQQYIVSQYCKFFGFEFVKTSDQTYFDYTLLWRDVPIALAEVKRRYCDGLKWPDIMLSKHKVDKLLDADLPAIFIVGFDDGISWVRLTSESTMHTKMSGRTLNTRDQYDCEVCCHIPIYEFTKVSKNPPYFETSASPFWIDEIHDQRPEDIRCPSGLQQAFYSE